MPLPFQSQRKRHLSFERIKGRSLGIRTGRAFLKQDIGINKVPRGKEISVCRTVVSRGVGRRRRTAEARY